MKNEFHCGFQIDCESTQHAIRDSALGERACRGIAELLEAEELRGTFLVIPGDIEASGGLYRELEKCGHEVGLHVHPADQGYQEFLGVYGFEDQVAIIGEAADRFAGVMGHRPESVCIGYMSSNDYTYAAMEAVGIRQGVLSLPTRVLPNCASVWAGAPLGIHYVNRYNRILPGDMDLVDVPSTVDPESRMWGGAHPQDLRVELVDAKNHWYTIKKNVDRQMNDGLPMKHLLVGTHNTFDYSDERDFRRETLVKMIQHVRDIVDSCGSEMVGNTIKGIADEFRGKVPLDKVGETELGLDTRGRGRDK